MHHYHYHFEPEYQKKVMKLFQISWIARPRCERDFEMQKIKHTCNKWDIHLHVRA